MNKALSTKTVEVYKQALLDAENLAEKINNKVDAIIESIHKAFNVPYPESWYFDDVHNDEVGTISFGDDIYYVYYFNAPKKDAMYADKYNYYGCFPQRFLFMTSKEIEKEVGTAIKKQQLLDEKKRLKEKGAIDNLKEIKRAALKKLTRKEKEALGIV